jgi:hypothetical protein
MGKKLANNSLIVIVGFIASVIAIYSFLTGNQSLDRILAATPTPSLADGLDIENLAFCESQFFDRILETCTVSQNSFPKGIGQIYASWTYRGNYSGEYTRRWYSNDVYLDHLTRPDQRWGLDGQTDYTFISYERGFEIGEYKLEFRLNADNGLIFKAGFTVR